jgi:UDP-glucose-4-epimerase GalE
MKRSFLVVGGAGYVGSHCAKHLLQAGHDVSVFDNLSRGHRDAVGRANFIQGDVLDGDALRGAFSAGRFDAVLHFAAFCYVGESVEQPEAYYRNNFVGTLNLLDAMRDANVRRLVFSSTCATYGNPVELPMRESHPQDPVNPYGATKLMAERALRDYAGAWALDSVALRYFNAAGCDPEGELGERHDPETHLIPLVLAEAKRVRAGGDPEATTLKVHGTDYPTKDGTCVRDYVHVTDLAAAHLAAAERIVESPGTGFRAYNLGTGRGHSVLETIRACEQVVGTPIRYRSGARRPGDPPELVADARLARAELDWAPRFDTMESIVATAWKWMSAHR